MQKKFLAAALNELNRTFFLFCFGVILSGCGTTRISPSSLSRPESETVLKISHRYEYSRVATGKYSLTPGIYRAELQGMGGTFFRGTNHPIRTIGINEKRTVVQFFEGGVFVPDDKAISAKIYYYTGTFTPPRVYEETDVEPPLLYSPDADISGHPYQTDAPPNAADNYVTGLMASPTTTPGQILAGGIGAGIGLAIAQSMIKPDVGRIVFPDNQPNNNSLRDVIEW